MHSSRQHALTGTSANQIAARGLVRTFQVARVFLQHERAREPAHSLPGGRQPRRRAERASQGSRLLATGTLEHLAEEPASVLSGGQRMLLQACAGFI